MPTVRVTGTLRNPVGDTPLASTTVTFNLLSRFGTASAGYPAKSVSVVTDADGKLNGNVGIELAVPETGAAYYELVLPTGPGNSREHFYFYLTAGDDPISLQALMSDAGSPAEVDTVQAAINAALVAYLPLAGGTMTGALVLAGTPTDALHAATKAYVDANAGGASAFVDLTDGPGELGSGNQYLRTNNAGDEMEWATPDWLDLATGDVRYVRLNGATMTGPLTLPGNPTVALHAAPKQYVDAAVASALTQAAADLRYGRLAAANSWSGANVMEPPATSTVPLTINAIESQSADLQRWNSLIGTTAITAYGHLAAGGDFRVGAPANACLRMTNFNYGLANAVEVLNGGSFVIPGGLLHMGEISTPSVPAANAFYLFARDDGAGNTQALALFSTGGLGGFDQVGRLVVSGSGNTSSTVGAAGPAAALPATPEGYLITSVNGTLVKVPYYAV